MGIYVDNYFEIRKIKMREGCLYALQRPGKNDLVKEYFDNQLEAMFVARYVSTFYKGIYGPEARKAAKEAWRNSLNEPDSLVDSLIDDAQFFYPNTSRHDIIVAALEELLAQNRKK